MNAAPPACTASFDLASPVVHNGCRLCRPDAGGWSVTVPEVAWGYAVAFPLRVERGVEQSLQEDVILARISLGAIRGEIGIALLSRDGERVLVQRTVTESRAEDMVELVAGPIRDCGDLLIRNANPTGAPGRIELRSIESIVVDPTQRRSHALSDNRLGPVREWGRYYGDHVTSIDEAIRSWRYSEMEEPVAIDWLFGLKIWIYPDNELSRALYVSDTYEPNTLMVLRRFLAPGNVFLDLGANIGVFSLIGSRLVGPTGQVHAFEPSNREGDRLRNNVKLNGISNIAIVKAAVAESAGRGVLHLADDRHSGQNTLGHQFAYNGVSGGINEDVDLIAIDDYVRERNLARVDVMKLDIEGGEYRALAGSAEMIDRFRPVVIFEVSTVLLAANGCSVKDIELFFKLHRYRLCGISDEDGSLYAVSEIPGGVSENLVAYPQEKIV